MRPMQALMTSAFSTLRHFSWPKPSNEVTSSLLCIYKKYLLVTTPDSLGRETSVRLPNICLYDSTRNIDNDIGLCGEVTHPFYSAMSASSLALTLGSWPWTWASRSWLDLGKFVDVVRVSTHRCSDLAVRYFPKYLRVSSTRLRNSEHCTHAHRVYGACCE